MSTRIAIADLFETREMSSPPLDITAPERPQFYCVGDSISVMHVPDGRGNFKGERRVYSIGAGGHYKTFERTIVWRMSDEYWKQFGVKVEGKE